MLVKDREKEEAIRLLRLDHEKRRKQDKNYWTSIHDDLRHQLYLAKKELSKWEVGDALRDMEAGHHRAMEKQKEEFKKASNCCLLEV